MKKCPPIRGGYIPKLKQIAPAISEIQVSKVSVFVPHQIWCSYDGFMNA